MELSIVIVSYNVKHFLEHCLLSVRKAAATISHSIIVVDNNSADGSVSMIREKFPDITLIENQENLGFSKASNQGISVAESEFILLLNPDTVIDENSLTTCLRFMRETPDAGAVGLRMIDGKGKYLPESKRALPLPGVSFWKISGINRLFPSSPVFNRYYLGHLDPMKEHQVEVLTGAFMFIRSSVLEQTGLLDEQFFMYAEDIDLSYRITQNGFRNYYLPYPTIIHYKGESTSIGGFNYVLNFYRSMSLFARKHFKENNISFLLFFINLAIILRAALSIFKRTIARLIPVVIDGAVLLLGFTGLTKAWELIKYDGQYQYPEILTELIAPAFSLIFLISIAFWGGYKKKSSLGNLIRGLFIGSILVIVSYSLFPSYLRFSRAIVISFAAFALVSVPSVHLLLSLLRIQKIAGIAGTVTSAIIISNPADYDKIAGLLPGSGKRIKVIGRISPGDDTGHESLGSISRIDEIIRINRPDEIIINSSDLSTSSVISIIENSYLSETEKKIACINSEFVIGSRSGKSRGEVYTLSITSAG